MANATAKNEIQVVLQEWLGKKKVAKVAETVYAVMQTETQHTHNGKKFFINEDSNGALVLTMESTVMERIEKILSENLEPDEVQECLEQLMVKSISTETEMTAEIETISVEGSDSHIYSDLLEYSPADYKEQEFLENLRMAIATGVKPFRVPVCDPAINENGHIYFIVGCKPATDYSYNELKELASKNGIQLGSKDQYVLFLATIICRLLEEGWSMADAVFAVCCDSTKLGHYIDSANSKGLESTGSRKVAGKCDLANTCKILKNNKEDDVVLVAGGSFRNFGSSSPLANIDRYNPYRDYDAYHNVISVGWFVL